MKNIFLPIMVFFVISTMHAQVVNIPDANFKNALVSIKCADLDNNGSYEADVDTNNDGEIQVTEAEAVFRLDVDNQNISSLTGIEAFKNLKVLECSYNQLTSLDVTKNPKLTDLWCTTNQLTSLDLTKNPKLAQLYCRENQLTSLDVTNNPKLNFFHCETNQLTSLDLTKNIELTFIICYFNQLTSLDVTNNPKLTHIECFGNQLTSLDVTNNPKLTQLVCLKNNLTNLDLTNNPELTNLYCYKNQLTSLDITNNPALTDLDCSNNQLTSLDLTKNPKLTNIECFGNQLTSLDLTNNPELTQLSCHSNQLTSLDFSPHPSLVKLYCGQDSLKFLSIKNGNNLFEELVFCENDLNKAFLDISNSPNLQYICADEEELACVQKLVDSLGYFNCLVGTYCSITPGGDYHVVTGNSSFDKDNNGCDSNDIPLPVGLKINVSGDSVNYTYIGSHEGKYSIPVKEDGVYSLTPIFENPAYFNAAPTNFTVNFPTDGTPFVQDICITPEGNHPDLEIVVVPIDRARPGFNAKYKIRYKNKGNTPQSGTVTLAFQDDYMDFLAANPSVDVQAPNLLTWNFSNLLPLEAKKIEVSIKLNAPTDTPPLNGGEVINFTGTINPVSGDFTPQDNTQILAQPVVNSFDPNDKTCLEGTVIKPTDVGNFVHYLVRFENKGTAEAVNIIVKDVIDTLRLDVNSLIPLDASHGFFTKITEGNKVEFIFENINLPFDSANNKGYFLFKVKTLPTLIKGDVFENSAEIYFDYNFPIITDRTSTKVNINNNVNNQLSNNGKFKMFPNPNKGEFTVRLPEPIESITIHDLSGRVLQTVSVVGNRKEVQVSTQNLSKGTYLVSVRTGKNKYVKKLMKN